MASVMRGRLAALAFLVAACSDDNRPGPTEFVPISTGPMIVSEGAFVSIPAGQRADAFLVEIRKLRSSSGVTTAVVDGALDPAVIDARAGDTIRVVVSNDVGAAIEQYTAVVPVRRRPVVIRTIPPRGKKGVPLNAYLTVVFSEPVSVSSMASIRLLKAGAVVPGTVSADDDQLRAFFSPTEPLQPNTVYELVTPTDITDLDGDQLEHPVTVDFTTGASSAVAFLETQETAMFAAPSNGAMRTFEMNAFLREDGAFEGSFRILYPSTGGGVSGRVTCFTIGPGGEAWAAGTVENARDPSLNGQEFAWRMLDGGKDGTSDRLSLAAYLNPERWVARDFCAVAPRFNPDGTEFRMFGLTGGDLSVRGKTPPPTAGSLSVIARILGNDKDADGFDLRIGAVQVHVARDTNFTIVSIPAGSQPVLSAGVAPNCHSHFPDSVTIRPGERIVFGGHIECFAASDGIEVTTRTSGVELDPDGYSIHASRNWRTGVNATTLVYNSYGGAEHLVTLEDVAANCEVVGENPRSVPRSAQTAKVTFDVTCGRTELLAFAGTVSEGASSVENTDIYVSKTSGHEVTRLTTHAARDDEPAWSPDGARLAFRSERDGNAEIYVMNANGSGLLRVTNNAFPDYQPTWSPDGTRIAFVSERDGNAEIYVIGVDGENALRLTNDPERDEQPSWSQANGRIAFRSERHGNGDTGDIMSMKADGSDVVRLTTRPADDATPAWSPDGSRIAFAREIACSEFEDNFGLWPCYGLYIMNADGRDLAGVGASVPYHPGARIEVVVLTHPSWSPDGREIAMAARYCLNDVGDCHEARHVLRHRLGTSSTQIVVGAQLDNPDARAAASPAWRRVP